MKVLLKRFQLNGHTIGFHPHTHRVLSTDSFSCGCRRVNGPHWDLEFRFYSSSYNFKSSGLSQVGAKDVFASLGRRIFGSKWTGCMLFNIRIAVPR